jgi:hypothetical protein
LEEKEGGRLSFREPVADFDPDAVPIRILRLERPSELKPEIRRLYVFANARLDSLLKTECTTDVADGDGDDKADSATPATTTTTTTTMTTTTTTTTSLNAKKRARPVEEDGISAFVDDAELRHPSKKAKGPTFEGDSDSGSGFEKLDGCSLDAVFFHFYFHHLGTLARLHGCRCESRQIGDLPDESRRSGSFLYEGKTSVRWNDMTDVMPRPLEYRVEEMDVLSGLLSSTIQPFLY